MLKLGTIGLGSLVLSSYELFIPSKAEAYPGISTLPDEHAFVSSDLALKLTTDNSTCKWHSIEGKTVDGGSNGCYFVIPSKGKDKYGGWDISNFLTINYSNAGFINNNALDVVVEFDKLFISRRDGITLPDYIPFYINYPSQRPAFGNPNCVPFGLKPVNHQMLIDYSVKILYAYTHELVDIPFYQRVSDIDLRDSYYTESWSGDYDSFSDFYVYESCKLKINGNKFSANGSTSGLAAEIQQAGVVAKTYSGLFSGQFEVDGCGSGLEIFTQFTNIASPEKLVKITN